MTDQLRGASVEAHPASGLDSINSFADRQSVALLLLVWNIRRNDQTVARIAAHGGQLTAFGALDRKYADISDSVQVDSECVLSAPDAVDA
jgi:hypothetical protein